MDKTNNTVLNDQMKISGYETYNSILNSGGIFAIVMFYILLVMTSAFVKMINMCLENKSKNDINELEGGELISEQGNKV